VLRILILIFKLIFASFLFVIFCLILMFTYIYRRTVCVTIYKTSCK